MLPAHNRVDSPLDLSARLVDARAAWERGDFPACEALLDKLPPSANPDHDAEAVLLRARALLREDRPADAVDHLAHAAPRLRGADAYTTGRMLLGTAVARAQSVPDGLALLDAAARFGTEHGAHRAVLAEIDYYRALALRQVGDRERADAYAAAASRAGADTISARATALRGWIAEDGGRYREAHAHFSAAGRALDTCHALDVDLAARVAHALAMLEADLRCATFTGAHRERYRRDAVTPILDAAAAPAPRLLALVADAWAFALDGEVTCALDRIWQANPLGQAAGPAWHVAVIAEMAAVTRAVGEIGSARKLAEMAAERAESVNYAASRGEQRFALLVIADELARFDSARATAVLARYDALADSIDTGLTLHGDPRARAQEQYVRGIVRRAHGDIIGAYADLHDAATLFREAGYLWRSALALIELDATPLPGLCSTALEAAAVMVREHFPHSFLAGMLGPWGVAYADGALGRLKPHLREVLRLLAVGGHSSKEIAFRTGKSLHTIRSYTRDLHAAFNVHSTRELLAEARARGIV